MLILRTLDCEISKIPIEITEIPRAGAVRKVVSYLQKISLFCSSETFLIFRGPSIMLFTLPDLIILGEVGGGDPEVFP